METNEKKEFINDNIIYKKTLSISGIIYLAIAIAIFFGNTLIQGENTSLKMAMMIAGSIFVIIGLVKIMAGKKKIVYKANGCPMKNAICTSTIMKCIDCNNHWKTSNSTYCPN